MPTRERVQAFVDMVERGEYVEAILQFYTDDATMQENLGEVRTGRQSLADFEDPEFYDRMTRARREASSRPLALVRRPTSLVQNAIALSVYGVLLLELSVWAVLGVKAR